MMDVDEGNDIPEPTEPKFEWRYFDEEEEFDKLIEGCNQKGIRERKLQENLKKIRDRVKLKKSSKKQREESKEETKDESKEETLDEQKDE